MNLWTFMAVLALTVMPGQDQAWADAASRCQMLTWTVQHEENPFPACKEAAEAGDAYAQNFMGVSYVDGNQVKQDANKAITWFRKAANHGFASAQSNLGLAYAAGFGVKQDFIEAKKWWRMAAKQGDPVAQIALGVGNSANQDQVVVFKRKFAAEMFYRAGIAYLYTGDPSQARACATLIRQLHASGKAAKLADALIAHIKSRNTD